MGNQQGLQTLQGLYPIHAGGHELLLPIPLDIVESVKNLTSEFLEFANDPSKLALVYNHIKSNEPQYMKDMLNAALSYPGLADVKVHDMIITRGRAESALYDELLDAINNGKYYATSFLIQYSNDINSMGVLAYRPSDSIYAFHVVQFGDGDLSLDFYTPIQAAVQKLIEENKIVGVNGVGDQVTLPSFKHASSFAVIYNLTYLVNCYYGRKCDYLIPEVLNHIFKNDVILTSWIFYMYKMLFQ